MKLLNVPFVRDDSDRCVPATIGMVLAYFMPERQFSDEDLNEISGYKQGRGTWQTQSMLSLADLGFETKWIEDFDHKRFIKNPEEYLRSILDDEAFQYQLHNTDLKSEAVKMRAYLAKHPIEQRKGTVEDIKQLINDGWLIWLEVNANPLAGKPGYEGHSVLVIGYDNDGVIIHNPDGTNGNIPNQHVSYELLDQAWHEFGGSYSLYAFKK